MDISKLEKINIVNQEHLIKVLEGDLSLNDQLGLHNVSAVSIDYEKDRKDIYERVSNYFSKGYINKYKWPSLQDFIRPFGNTKCKNLLLNFYSYDYYGTKSYENYIFTFPKMVQLNNKDYFLGNYEWIVDRNILTDYIFVGKDIPTEFIYGVLIKTAGLGFELVKNPNHLRLKSNEEKNEFYCDWLKNNLEILEAVDHENCNVNDGFNGLLIAETIKQKSKVIQKKK